MLSPKVCPYCGQAITSSELVKRIQKKEEKRLGELKSSLAIEWGRKEKELQRHIRDVEAETEEAKKRLRAELDEELKARESNIRREVAKDFQEERGELLDKVAGLSDMLEKANKSIEVERRQLDKAFKGKLEEERKRIFEEAMKQSMGEIENLDKEARELAVNLREVKKDLAEKEKTLKRTEEEYNDRIQEMEKQIRQKAEQELLKDHENELRERDLEVRRVKLESERERLHLQKEVEELNRRLERKTADELGRVPEEELEQLLREEFPGDRIVHLGKGKAGGDLIHTVVANEEEAGTIVYEVKNTLSWSNEFIEQAKKHRTTYKTPYVILVSRVFPSGEKDFTERDGILIVDAGKAPIVARLLRQSILELAKEKATGGEVQTKANELHAFIRSPEFKERLRAVFGGVERLRRLQEQEKRAHNRLWEKEAKEHRAIHDHMSGVEGRISSIVEGRIIHIPVPAQPKKKKKPLAEEIQSIANTLDHGD